MRPSDEGIVGAMWPQKPPAVNYMMPTQPYQCFTSRMDLEV
ncbi:hypothetical protein HMPREF1545_03038 [Oscillibacter sp. KLE 1728]|nr:hypothetical protein HMPREF1545_03038 [Oscillibacter sp. KLE 1728]